MTGGFTWQSCNWLDPHMHSNYIINLASIMSESPIPSDQSGCYIHNLQSLMKQRCKTCGVCEETGSNNVSES